MYVIAVYDMEAERTQLMLSLLRRYLTHVQNSVCEGELTDAQYAVLTEEIEETVKPNESVILYQLRDDNWLNRKIYGSDPMDDHRLI
ncbi:CRISPR-associated protein Cas2 [Haloferax gibbonsii ATCC 33959]|uniref:CRISPR-associated endoribonuclease Cas2 n=1 Tax=Haloferax gibbonsii (strain ATCC 33959 / DSM 4427 / JCM 8863 / NBRC 102184 / NCIMB 2188 / Ma 2.38) TaxID=1227459 RepID=M0HL02_HALGM|nr:MULTISPECIES: CRISPR-associated endonuclease Cas2 [Haloferax]ELZ84463.1 CRISPR-associated protein Cas2 [Haloferax gibbonsii ATCC 33959]